MNNNNLGSEVAVVLGSGIASDGTPARTTVLRVRAAARLAKAHPHVNLILSGDGRKQVGSTSEAEAMKTILLAEGISAARIFLEDQSQDTIGNAVLVAARYFANEGPVAVRKLYVVTSPFHLKRALIAFRAVVPTHWNVVSYGSRIAATDAERGRNERGGVQWMKDFFSGIEPGDIGAAVERLLDCRPHYRAHAFAWLKPIAEKFKTEKSAKSDQSEKDVLVRSGK